MINNGVNSYVGHGAHHEGHPSKSSSTTRRRAAHASATRLVPAYGTEPIRRNRDGSRRTHVALGVSRNQVKKATQPSADEHPRQRSRASRKPVAPFLPRYLSIWRVRATSNVGQVPVPRAPTPAKPGRRSYARCDQIRVFSVSVGSTRAFRPSSQPYRRTVTTKQEPGGATGARARKHHRNFL